MEQNGLGYCLHHGCFVNNLYLQGTWLLLAIPGFLKYLTSNGVFSRVYYVIIFCRKIGLYDLLVYEMDQTKR